MLSATILTANWLVGICCLLVLTLLAPRTPNEERKLLDKFEIEYLEYKAKNGDVFASPVKKGVGVDKPSSVVPKALGDKSETRTGLAHRCVERIAILGVFPVADRSFSVFLASNLTRSSLAPPQDFAARSGKLFPSKLAFLS